jgi:hypothetical protein
MPVLACPNMASAHTCLFMQVCNSSPIGIIHPHHPQQSQQHQTCPPIIMQPMISALLKAIRHGFLKGCPNLTTAGVTRYLNPSPASAKGHTKHLHQGIHSTRLRQIRGTSTTPVPAPQLVAPVLPLFQDALPYPGPAYGTQLFLDPYNDTSLASDPHIDGRPPGANIIAATISVKKETCSVLVHLQISTQVHYKTISPV